MYEVDYMPQAVKSIKKLNPHIKSLLKAWIEKNLMFCINPRLFGKALSANLVGAWRYRVGDYRIIVYINDNDKIVSIFDIGHRKDIY